MAEGIRAPNLPLGTSIAELLGLQTDGANKSLKRFSRSQLMGSVESRVTVLESAANASGLIYASRAALLADTSKPLNTMAQVRSDPTAAYNGIYERIGSSWTRVADLPDPLIYLTVTGGTGDAIVATSSPQSSSAPSTKLFMMVPTANSTGAVTIVVDGGAAVPIKSMFGDDLTANALVHDTPYLLNYNVDHYQLFLPTPVEADTVLASVLAARDTAGDYATSATASASALGNQVHQYDTRDLAIAATIPALVVLIRTFGYTTAGDGGGALYRRAASEPAHAGKLQSADGAWWEIAEKIIYPEMFGAVMSQLFTGVLPDLQPAPVQAANVTAFQNALDFARQIRIRDLYGHYDLSGELAFKDNFYSIIGPRQGMAALVYTGTAGNFIYNDANTTEIRTWCALENIWITAPNLTSGTLINWKSFQFGRIRNVWLSATVNVGVVALDIAGHWVGSTAVTEGTYNIIDGCYIGNCSTCVRLQDGANNNTFSNTRFQPAVSGGAGIFFLGSDYDRINCVKITACGFEYPGGISNGVSIFSGTRGVFIEGCRFELLANGIIVGSTNVADISANAEPINHFSGCTINVNYSGSKGAQPCAVASGAVSSAGAFVDKPFNLTCTKGGTGDFTFFFPAARPNANYKVSPVGVGGIFAAVISQSTTAFRVITYDIASLATSATPTDPSLLTVAVMDNT